MQHPPWFTALFWSQPVPIEVLRTNRDMLPHKSGVYCFTSYPDPLDRDYGVLYIGKAGDLSTRVVSYLSDPEKVMVQSTRSKRSPWNTSLKHPGKALMLMEVQAKYRDIHDGSTYVWVRWTETVSPLALESELLAYLRPKYAGKGVPR